MTYSHALKRSLKRTANAILDGVVSVFAAVGITLFITTLLSIDNLMSIQLITFGASALIQLFERRRPRFRIDEPTSEDRP